MKMNQNRRQFLSLLGLSFLATQLPTKAQNLSPHLFTIKPPQLHIGDTIGLINPAGDIQPEDLQEIQSFLLTNGFKIKQGKYIFDQYGYLAGIDQDRATDVNEMFADAEVQALLTIRGGWGCNRILELLDYDLIALNPKIIMGYSDITSLLLAIYAKTGMITFHGAVALSTWNDFTINYMEKILLEKQILTLQNLPELKVETITSGTATGKIVGGNLAVLTSMIGSNYLPSWENTILFVEEIGEDIYRIDRMITQLKLAGILNQISGFIFASCKNCQDLEDPSPTLTLNQVLADHIKPLNIPAWFGSMIGHITNKFTIPIGLNVEIDADLGTIKMLETAVI
jgi:muramoyltetrapeptide carboxypeptidase